jgi:hypothetical protein
MPLAGSLLLKYDMSSSYSNEMSVQLHRLVDYLSCVIMTTIAGKGSTDVQVNLSTETCQNGSQNPVKRSMKGRDIDTRELQNPYKLLLNPELMVFIEKPDEYASYQYRFEDNR